MAEEVIFDDGTYKWVLEDDHSSAIYRKGYFWKDTSRDNFLKGAIQEICDLRKELTEAVEYLENSGVDWDEIRGGL